MWLTALACAVLLAAQNFPAGEPKHLSVPVGSSAQPFVLAAIEIDRGVQYPSVVHLKGDVVIRMPVCVVTGPGTVQHCAGEIIFRADEADLHEDTGQIEARGAVRVDRK
jgi:lipopolysaccharide assembly outer membrane protein LptD (OstA)